MSICSVQGCESNMLAKRLCNTHYRRMRRNGHLNRTTIPADEAEACFQRLLLAETDSCVVWPYRTNKHGYGEKGSGDAKILVHRAALEYWAGPAPEGLPLACHGPCHNPSCMNARGGHLYWGSPQQNAADRLRDGTHQLGESNAMSIVTATQVLEIRERAAAGASYKALSTDYNMSLAGISDIANGRRWKHVGGPINTRGPGGRSRINTTMRSK